LENERENPYGIVAVKRLREKTREFEIKYYWGIKNKEL
jgi:hypothetical protein